MTDVALLAEALCIAGVECDYSVRYYRKTCHPGDGPHSVTASVVAAVYDRLVRERYSPPGHGTPVPEEAELPSGDARIEAL